MFHNFRLVCFIFIICQDYYACTIAIQRKAINTVCDPNYISSYCGFNAVCSPIPGCDVGICTCKNGYEPNDRNMYDCDKKWNDVSGNKICSGLSCGADFNESCNPAVQNCHCRWPLMQRADGTCYNIGFNSTCNHDHECQWMYKGTRSAVLSSGNSICDRYTKTCRCAPEFVAVRRIRTNFNLPWKEQVIPIILDKNQQTLAIPTEQVCIKKQNIRSADIGDTCSYRVLDDEFPIICKEDLICQFCPLESTLNDLGFCVNPEKFSFSISKKGIDLSGSDDITKIIVAVCSTAVMLIIICIVFYLWRRHQRRLLEIDSSVMAIKCIPKPNCLAGDSSITCAPRKGSQNDQFCLENSLPMLSVETSTAPDRRYYDLNIDFSMSETLAHSIDDMDDSEASRV